MAGSELSEKCQAAMVALALVTKDDLREACSWSWPPTSVQLVLEAVCILLGKQPTERKVAVTGGVVVDYWKPSVELLQLQLKDPENGLLKCITRFDVDRINPAVLLKIQQYTAMPECDPERVKWMSKLVHGLCLWVHAVNAHGRSAQAKGTKPEEPVTPQQPAEQHHGVPADINWGRA